MTVLLKDIKVNSMKIKFYLKQTLRFFSEENNNLKKKERKTGNETWFLVEISKAKQIYEHTYKKKDIYTDIDVAKYYKKSNKMKFIKDEWNAVNSENKIEKVETIYDLASKFKKIGKWLEKIDIKYNALIEAPDWLKAHDPSSTMWDKRVQEYCRIENEYFRERNLELQKLSAERLKRINEIDRKYKEKVLSLIEQCPEVAINGMTPDSMPLSDQIQSETIVDEEERKEFIKEKLRDHKLNIYKKYKEGTYTKDDLIELLNEKL